MYTREELLEAGQKAVDAGDSTSANEIASLLAEMDKEAQPPPVTPETYLEGVQRRYGEADFEQITSSFKPELTRRAAITGDPTDLPAQAISQAARTGGELVMEAGSVVLPDIAREFASEAYDGFMQTGYGQAAGRALNAGYEAYMEWRGENPEAAEKFETTVDVVSLMSPRPDLINLDAKAASVKKSGDKIKRTKQKEALKGLVEPESKGTWDRTESSVPGLNVEQWVPDAFSEQLLETLVDTPGIKPFGTVHENFRVIQNALNAEKERLTNFVKSQNRKIDTEDIDIEFVNAFDAYQNSNVYQLASKAAKKQFTEYVNLARKIVKEEGADLSSVLEARRKFDEAVQNSGKTLDADVATYQAEAAKLVRGVLNDFLKRNTSGDDVHNLLDMQFKQLVALDRMVGKRNKEATNSIGRLKQTFTNMTGVVIPSTVGTVLATTVAVGGMGAGWMMGAASAVGGGLVGLQVARHGKKAVMQTYAFSLSVLDRAIKTTNDPARLEILELDRQVMVALLEEARASEEPKEDE